MWLKDMTNKGKISVVQADKGDAILIVTPELLRRKVLEKLDNPLLYTKLEHDPLNNLKKELFETVCNGYKQFVQANVSTCKSFYNV